TGPYRFVRYVPGSQLVLERVDGHWEQKPHWQEVNFRIISNDAARVAALLAGDVDIANFVPTTDVAQIRANPRLTLWQTPSEFMIYLMANFNEQNSFVTDKQGRPLAKNPTADIRVRKAISKAIDRQAIVDRVMQGLAVPAGAIVREGFHGYSPSLKVEA